MLAVCARFPALCLRTKEDGSYVVGGTLGFQATYAGHTVETDYDIEIGIPTDYPASVPTVQETGGRIPRDFHKMEDGVLCLGAPLEIRMKFAEDRSMLGFIERQLVPYLFGHACFERDGTMPFGELGHGSAGVLAFYKDLFGVQDDLAALRLLRVLADDDYRGPMPCPCGSGLKLRHCHGPVLLEAKQHQAPGEVLREHTAVLSHLHEENPDIDLLELATKTLKQKLRKKQHPKTPRRK